MNVVFMLARILIEWSFILIPAFLYHRKGL